MYVPAEPVLHLKMLRGGGPAPGSLLQWPGAARVLFFESGRAAFWGALQALGLRTGEILLPAYLCPSLLTALAVAGLKVRFYRLGRDLVPDMEDLVGKIGPEARAVTVIHYYGFPFPMMGEIRELCRHRNLHLIEDCAHVLFGRHGALGTYGGASFFSLRKWLPIPDGGALLLNNGSSTPDEVSIRAAGIATYLAIGYRLIGSLETRLGHSPRLFLLQLNGLRRFLYRLDRETPVRFEPGITSISKRLIQGASLERIVEKRRSNYRALLKGLGPLGWVKPLFPDLPDGVCPFGLPLLVEKRDVIRNHLLSMGVNVRCYWDVLPDQIDQNVFLDSKYLSDGILVLPIHQDIANRHVDRIIEEFRKLGKGKSLAKAAYN